MLSLLCCLVSCKTRASDAPSLREKIAKMLIVSFDGKTAEETGTITDIIKNEKIGGVVIFGYNVGSPESLKVVCTALQGAADYPLIISIDQEGGYIQRLKKKDGFKETISQQRIGEKDDVKITEHSGEILASQLKDIGINLNFAPVVDLNVNPSSPIIGKYERAFSDDPDKVVLHASAEIKAHHRNGVLTAVKHFPGHGSSLQDSHLGLTDITNTWSEKELEPYKSLIGNEYNDIIMVSHLFNSNIDKDYPASLSEKTVNGLLRGKLGWKGAVITDDMQMGAITEHYGLTESLILAINAGVDMLIVTRRDGTESITKIIDALEEAVNEGKINNERIDEAYERITALTARLDKNK